MHTKRNENTGNRCFETLFSVSSVIIDCAEYVHTEQARVVVNIRIYFCTKQRKASHPYVNVNKNINKTRPETNSIEGEHMSPHTFSQTFHFKLTSKVLILVTLLHMTR